MPTQPSSPNEAPRSEDKVRDEVPPVPDEPGPHDVPDEQVIEQTLPAGSRRGEPQGPR